MFIYCAESLCTTTDLWVILCISKQKWLGNTAASMLNNHVTVTLISQKRWKTSKDEVDSLCWRCRYCKAHQGARFFDCHEAACKAQWIIQNEMHQQQSSTTQLQYHLPEGFIQGSSKMWLEDTIMDSEADQLDVSDSRELVEPNLSKQIIFF